MSPVSVALDILQGQENVAVSYLLPTLSILSSKLNAMTGLKHCQPLVANLLSSISERFGQMFKDNELRLASVCDPRFKLKWMQESEHGQLENLLKDAYKREKDV